MTNSAARSDTAGLLHALAFAADRHRKQRRKGDAGLPYVNHLIEVARLIAEVGGVTDPATLAAAVLHDVVEDTPTTLDEIEREFGREVRDLVAECTDDKSLPSTERKRLQIENAPGASRKAKTIKIADKIANVVDLTNAAPPDWTLERRRGYFDWSEKVVAGLRGTNAALERRYDEVLARGRLVLAAHTPDVPETAPPSQRRGET